MTEQNAELMELMGQQAPVAVNTDMFPFMKIQMDDADNDGKEVPRGSYRLYVTDKNEEGKDIYVATYCKEVKFVPLVNSYQYRIWNQKEGKFTVQSIMFKNWKQDIFSSDGTLACGKIATKNLGKLTEAEQAKQRSIRCVRNLFGLVSGKFKSADGKEYNVDGTAVIFQSGGRSFRTIGDVLDALNHSKKLICTHPWALTTNRVKTGGNSTYEAVAKPDETATLNVTPEWIELIKRYNAYMDEQNRPIVASWQKYQDKRKDVVEVPVDVVKALEADFNDDPFPKDDNTILAAG